MTQQVTRKRKSSAKACLAPHGTWTRYCSPCRCACTEYGRARRKAKADGMPFVPPAHLIWTPPVDVVPPAAVVEEVSGEYRRYNFPVTVEPAVERRLARVLGCSRYVYNSYIALARDEFAAGRAHPKLGDSTKVLVTQARNAEETSWLSEVPHAVLAASVRNAALTYDKYFDSVMSRRKGRRLGRPRFQKRDHRQAAYFPLVAFTINGGHESTRSRSGGRLWLAKVGYLDVRWTRSLPNAPTSVTVIRDRTGKYQVSFVVKTAPAVPRKLGQAPRTAGIDLGLTHLATIVYSDGEREKIENPRYLRRSEQRLRRLQQDLSRKQKGSRNREKQRRKVALAHQRVVQLRSNAHRQLASKLARENQAVVCEDLNVAGLLRGRLAKSISDASWSQLVRYAEEACQRDERQFIQVDRFFPSSQLCSACGVKMGKQPLHVRQITCQCGAVLDRDFNAAVNIMVAAGPAETLNACGRDIRRKLAAPAASCADTDEAGTHPKPLVARRKPAAGARPGGSKIRATQLGAAHRVGKSS